MRSDIATTGVCSTPKENVGLNARIMFDETKECFDDEAETSDDRQKETEKREDQMTRITGQNHPMKTGIDKGIVEKGDDQRMVNVVQSMRGHRLPPESGVVGPW